MVRLLLEGWRAAWVAALLLGAGLAGAAQPVALDAALAQAAQWRRTGHVQDALAVLHAVDTRSATTQQALRWRGELGATLLQARRLDEAQPHLQAAFDAVEGPVRPAYGVHLANLLAARGQHDAARRTYAAVLDATQRSSPAWFAAAANLTRLLPEAERLPHLVRVGRLLDEAPAAPGAGQAHLNLGEQARGLGAPALALAWHHLNLARQMAARDGDARAGADAADALAQLYEDQGRDAEALLLSRQALAQADPQDEPLLADVHARLHWRSARIHARTGQAVLAKSALARAVELVRSIRSDLPIEYDDGSSSYRATIEPLYLSYANALLRESDGGDAARAAGLLKQVVELLEELKQAELQDYLGDRCAVESVQGGVQARLPEGVAALYTVVYPERVELLLLLASGIERRTVPVASESLLATATAFARDLRAGTAGFEAAGRQLHAWLVAPVQAILQQRGVHSLVVVPDASLRLLPYGAFLDGSRYLLESYAVSTVTGLSITNAAPRPGIASPSLVVGVSHPGPVVDKLVASPLGESLLRQVADGGPAATAKGRGAVRSAAGAGVPSASGARAAKVEAMREHLRLPGVASEVAELRGVLRGRTLLNEEFTLQQFAAEAGSGKYRMLHIASHGVFGGTGASSFILAFDDLLTMDGLQAILRSEAFTRNPIELLALSACETAEGNTRAPLGFSGVAVKARAKAVLGSLWPVDDDGAQRVMSELYAGLVRGGLSKTQALRQAQLVLLRDPHTRHPVFWAPFLLIGNWS